MFTVPRWRILFFLVILWLFFEHNHELDICGLDWNFSTPVGCIVICHIQMPIRMKCNHFSDPLNFNLKLSSGQNFYLSIALVHEIWIFQDFCLHFSPMEVNGISYVVFKKQPQYLLGIDFIWTLFQWNLSLSDAQGTGIVWALGCQVSWGAVYFSWGFHLFPVPCRSCEAAGRRILWLFDSDWTRAH